MGEFEQALSAEGLWKRYRRGGPWALCDVSLTVPVGSITAIVGPNGAGKSTLIRTWMGFERPTGGGVRVAGIDPWVDRPAALASLGYVPQAASLYRDLTVAEHLEFARVLRPGFDRSLAVRRLAALGIPPRQRASDLSGGQQAQLGLALALGTRAPVLLLDEPLASLDPLARRDFLGVMIESVRDESRTAFLSSHIVTDIEQAADRLIVLSAGRVLLDDGVAAAQANHRTLESPDGLPPWAIGAFAGPAGERLVLIAADSASGGRPATLEEIVLGHLAAGRALEVADSGWAA